MSAPPRAPTFPGLDNAVTDVVDDSFEDTTSTTSSAFTTPAAAPRPVASGAASSSSAPVATPAGGKSRLRAILTWKNPKVSAMALGVCLIFFYFTLWKKYSILSVFGATLALYLIFGLIVVNVNKMILGGSLDRFVKRPPVSTPLLNTASMYKVADTIVEEGNEFAEDARNVFYCDNTPLTVAYILIGVAVYVIGKFVPPLVFFFIFTMLAFIVPIAYEKNKKEVDAALTKASDVASKHLESGRKIAVERSYKLKDMAAERSAPYLEKNATVKGLADKVGFTPTKKNT